MGSAQSIRLASVLLVGFFFACSAGAPSGGTPPVYSFDSMITLPNDMSQVTYPTSYTKASVGSVKVTDPYCGTDPSTISFPASYLGAYALPQATGYPLNAAIRRGYSMKDVWQPGDPSFNTGCVGDIRSAFLDTINRVKASGGNYIVIDQWTDIDDSNPSSWSIVLPDNVHSSTIGDSDLAWAVSEIHAAGLEARLQIQIQQDMNGNVPPTTQNNITLFLAAYDAYMVNRGQLAQQLGIDAMSLDCNSWTTFTGFETQYSTGMVTVAQDLKAVYSGKLWFFMDSKLFADSRLINYVDYMLAIPYYSSFSAADVSNLSVALVKSKLAGSLNWIAANAPASKQIIWRILAPSRADYFTSGYIEETFCTPGNGSACIQKTETTDFSLQAIVYEAELEIIGQSSLDIGNVETDGYWLMDNVLPDSTFPNIAFSVRSKPAEALLRLWYR